MNPIFTPLPLNRCCPELPVGGEHDYGMHPATTACHPTHCQMALSPNSPELGAIAVVAVTAVFVCENGKPPEVTAAMHSTHSLACLAFPPLGSPQPLLLCTLPTCSQPTRLSIQLPAAIYPCGKLAVLSCPAMT